MVEHFSKSPESSARFDHGNLLCYRLIATLKASSCLAHTQTCPAYIKKDTQLFLKTNMPPILQTAHLYQFVKNGFESHWGDSPFIKQGFVGRVAHGPAHQVGPFTSAVVIRQLEVMNMVMKSDQLGLDQSEQAGKLYKQREDLFPFVCATFLVLEDSLRLYGCHGVEIARVYAMQGRRS